MLVRLIAWTAIAVSTVLVASEAFAQSSSGPAGRSVWSARSAIGFTADPDAFLMSFEGDYRFSQSTSLGLLLFLGVEDDMNLVAPQIYGRYTFEFGDAKLGNANLRQISPFVQAGMGFTLIDRDLPNSAPLGSDDDDTGFLVSIGGGIDYQVTEAFSVGSRMLLNFLPVDAFDENFYFSWEILTVGWRF